MCIFSPATGPSRMCAATVATNYFGTRCWLVCRELKAPCARSLSTSVAAEITAHLQNRCSCKKVRGSCLTQDPSKRDQALLCCWVSVTFASEEGRWFGFISQTLDCLHTTSHVKKSFFPQTLSVTQGTWCPFFTRYSMFAVGQTPLCVRLRSAGCPECVSTLRMCSQWRFSFGWYESDFQFVLSTARWCDKSPANTTRETSEVKLKEGPVFFSALTPTRCRMGRA